ncbi:MAG TPA: M14 family zinc carboxypeptidase [Patescibacteria group bacterium]|nr:M14 family zinc carboxypeptidase [Patescibacteria group bacterium]
MKVFLLVLIIPFIFFINTDTFAQKTAERYSLVKAWFSGDFTSETVEDYGFEAEHSIIRPDNYIEGAISERCVQILQKRQVQTEIIIPDLSLFYKERAKKDELFLKDFAKNKTLAGSTIPRNFSLGSMAGFYTLEEIGQVFSSMRQKFPELVSEPIKIGTSIEGRNINAYRFSTPIFTNSKHEVLYTALHHAREPGGVTTLVYFLWDILERYTKGDPEAVFLMEKRELYVVPVINPDGYAYNQQTNPDGGGMWRKNRRKVSQEAWGIDLNRNYGPQESWDAPVNGSSVNPVSETYRGSAPFSEPETQAIRDFCRSHNFKNALNYHTYGGLLIYPFATKQTETPDSIIFRGLAAEFIKINKYAAGTGIQTVGYNVRGDSDEWMYLSDPQKSKIFAMTPEAGTIIDGFWPRPERIIPIAQENLHMNYQLAWSAGVNIRPQHISSQHSDISIDFSNIGILTSTDSIEISVASLHPLVFLGVPVKKIAPLSNREIDIVTIPFQLANGFKNGDRVKITVAILQENVRRVDTMEVQLYKSTVRPLFSGENNGSWNTGLSWAVVTDHFGVRSFTDSPDERYDNLTSNYLTFNQLLPLTGINRATLRFKTRWSIESNGDFAVVEVSADGGNSWKTIKTSRMKRGIGLPGTRQEINSFGFDGNFPEWILQEASLDEFTGKNINVRFGMLSDDAGIFDGWYLADIDLITYETTTGMYADAALKEALTVFPNPVDINTKLTITNPFKNESPVELRIVNILGEIVFKSENFFKNPSGKLFLHDQAPGVYQIILRQGSKEISGRLVIQ